MLNFSKHSVETYPVGIDYATAAPLGATVASGVWAAVDKASGADASADVLQAQPAVIDGQVAMCRVLGGLLHHVYQLSITVTFDTGDVLHDYIDMVVIAEG